MQRSTLRTKGSWVQFLPAAPDDKPWNSNVPGFFRFRVIFSVSSCPCATISACDELHTHLRAVHHWGENADSMDKLHLQNATLLPLGAGRRHTAFNSVTFILIAIVLGMIFAYFGSEVAEGDHPALDLLLVQYAKELRLSHLWLAEVLRDLSGLGSTVVLTLLTLACVGYQALFSSRRTAALVATSVITGTLLVSLFKLFFGRARPDPSYAEFVVSGMSFPSGHSTMSALVFLTIGAVIANKRGQLSEKIYILAAAGFMSFLVGLSRIGLGVHWATDVVGGWSFGAAWAILWLVIANWRVKRA